MNFIKKNKYLFLTFGFSFIIICTLFIIKNVLPFGKNSLLTIDFYYQYGPLLNELIDKVKSGNFLFSWNTGIGIPFFKNFLNYLSSPFNILLFLFKREHILTAFSLIIGIKACLSSTFMAYYLKKTFKTENMYICIFGVLYGFSSYFTAYYWNLMWLDGMVLLPIICLGINRLIEKNKIDLYVISLVIMLFANYFIGYMICIFAVLYFICYILITQKFNLKLFFKKGCLFAFSSLIAGGICAIFLIPMFFSLRNISATGDEFKFYEYFNFNLIYLIPNSLSGVIATVFSNGTSSTPIPNIACGILTFILAISFFFNKDVNLKTKIISAVLLLFFIFSFVFKPADFIWHAFHVPNDLPYRYSFIYIFMVIILAFYALNKLQKIKPVFIILTFLLIFISVIIFYLTGYFNFKLENAFFILLFIFIYFICYLLFITKSVKITFLKRFLILLVFLEIVISTDINWDINQDSKSYMENYTEYREISDILKEENNGSFYRTETNSFKSLNDGALYNYNGITSFSSVAYEKIAKMMKKMGLGSNDVNSYYYQPNTPIFDMLFSLKYTYGYREDNRLYENINILDRDIYKFNYTISPVFAVSNNIQNWELYGNPFSSQEDFISKATGIENIFTQIEPSFITDENDNLLEYNGAYIFINNNSSVKISLKSKTSNTYIYLYNENIDYFEVNDRGYYTSPTEPFIIDIGNNSENIDINVYFKNSENNNFINFYAYEIDIEKFISAYNILKENEIKIFSYTDNSLKGKIKINKNQIGFTSIAYDEGWNVYIDEKKVNTFEINSLLAFDVTKGMHDIKLIYKPKELNISIIISFISLFIFIIYLIIEYKKSKKVIN